MKTSTESHCEKRKIVRSRSTFFFAILIIQLTLSFVLNGCGNGGQKSGQSNKPRATLVDAAPVQSENVQVILRSVGSLEAVDSVEIAPEINGTVAEILFKENEQVHKGDLLVRLDDRKLRLALQQAEDSLQTARATSDLAGATIRRTEADVENAKSTFERDKELYDSGIVSESGFIQAKTAYESAVAAVEEAKAGSRRAGKEVKGAETTLALAKERLADTHITAPLSGVLGERLVSPGDYVEAGQTLVELVVLDPIEIAFSVPERYLEKVAVGQTVLFDAPWASGKMFSGETDFVSPVADPTTRSIKLKARIMNKDAALQPGLFGAVRLIFETHPGAAVIPESAVVPREDKNFVYVVNNSEAHLREVILGQHMDGRVEVLQGVKPGEFVITAGQQKVADKHPVRIRGNEDVQVQGSSEGTSANEK